jgi:hypothetical protein
MIKKIFQVVLLSAILIGLPLGSYIYLTKGLEFRKEKLSEMTDMGSLPGFTFENSDGELVSSTEYLEQKLVLIAVPDNDEGNDSLPADFRRIFDPFSDRDDLVAFYIKNKPQIKSVEIEYTPEDGYYELEASEYPQLTSELRKMIQEFGLPNHDAVLLVDGNGHVRNVYRPGELTDETKLVEHVAVLIPTLIKEDNGRR